MSNNKYVLKAEEIDKSFPGVHALEKVGFDLKEGEVHVLLGENGAGKSTLMKIFSGSEIKDSGRLLINGSEVEITDPHHARDLGIGMVYQNLSLIPTLNVAENIFLGRLPKRMGMTVNWPKIHQETRDLLSEFKTKIEPHQKISGLGMAERQLVEIAKALSMNVKILLLDEPTSALSYEERDRLFDTIRHLQSMGVGIVYVSHRLDEVSIIGQRVTVLRDGKKMGALEVKEAETETLIKMMVGREISEYYPKEEVSKGEEVLRVEGLTVEGKLRDLSLALYRGEIVGLAGLMGAGRTEFVRAIFGVDKIDRGKIYIEGRQAAISSPRDAIDLGMGFLTENRMEGLVPVLPVSANITMASLPEFRNMGFLTHRKERKLSSKYIQELNIHTASLFQRVQFLSGGNQQKVALAKWLCSNAKIMIFDEPTRGIDVGAKTEVFRLMNALAMRGVGIIMISSELPELIAMADRILVMSRGRFTGELEREKATQEEILKYAIMGG
ncbi:MAG: sugar ABC transporter ATP-binding protein [Spirochaetota bacterium]